MCGGQFKISNVTIEMNAGGKLVKIKEESAWTVAKTGCHLKNSTTA